MNRAKVREWLVAAVTKNQEEEEEEEEDDDDEDDDEEENDADDDELMQALDEDSDAELMAALGSDGALSGCEMGKAVALYSSAGCEQQPWHVDFDPMCKKRKGEERECIRDLRDSQKPKGVFWAIEEGSRLMVAGPEGESVEVHLERGDVLIFDGDLVHAGAGYEKSNVRVHVYLYACGVPKPNGNTYMVPGFVPVSKVHVQLGDRAAVI